MLMSSCISLSLCIIMQKSEGGLFLDMYTFLAFGKDYVSWNYEKTRDPVYLHIKQTQKPVAEDRPSKKPTLLAIGTACPFTHCLCLFCYM